MSESAEVVLVLRHQVDGMEPHAQRQLGGIEQGPRAEGDLGSAGHTLPVAAPVGVKAGLRLAFALRVDEPRGLACLLQCGLGAVLRDELVEGHAALKLDPILGHRVRSVLDTLRSVRLPGAQTVSPPAEESS